MKRIVLVCLIVVLFYTTSSCSFGPIQIEHTHGQMPKLSVSTGVKECRFSPKRLLTEKEQIDLVCKWQY